MRVDKVTDGLRAEVAQARAQENPDAEQAARKRLSALGITEAAQQRRVAAEQSPEGEQSERQQPPKSRRAPQHRTTSKRTAKATGNGE